MCAFLAFWQLATITQHRHRSVEALAYRHRSPSQTITLAMPRHLVGATLKADQQVARHLALMLLTVNAEVKIPSFGSVVMW